MTVLAALLLSAAAPPSMPLVGSPALSPDGREVAFEYAGDVWTASSEGGPARRLTVHAAQDGQPAYSPDGETIAFVSDRSGSRQIHLARRGGGGAPTRITRHTEGFSVQEYAPDGESILCVGRRDHHWRRPNRLLDVDLPDDAPAAGERVLFDAYANEGRWSPDATKVLFVREGVSWWRKGYVGSQASQIWLWDSAEGSFTQVLAHPAGSRSPRWKPDGSGFWYVGAESGSFNLRSYDFESGESTVLTSFEDDSVVDPAVSRDGSTIVFRHLFDLYRLVPGEEPVKLAFEPAGGDPAESAIRRTLSSASDAAFLPDGLEIVLAAGGDLWAMDTVLREPVQITRTAVDEFEPIVIEDGRAALFLRQEGGVTDVFRVAPEGGAWWTAESFAIDRVTDDAATESNIQASPDGKHFAVVKAPGDLWLMTLKGKPVRKLVSGFDKPNYEFSPDGEWVAYSAEDNDFNDDIWLVPTDGSREPFNVSRHPDDDYGPTWRPDGKAIAFTGRRYGDETDIYYAFLAPEDDQTSSRDRKLKEAREKIAKARKSSKKKPTDDGKTDAEKPAAGKKSGLPETPEIDFETLPDRVRRISISGVSERGLFWLDDERLAFSASIKGDYGVWTVKPGVDSTPKKLTGTTGSRVQRLDEGKLAWLTGGTPASLSEKGSSTKFSFSVRQEMPRPARQAAGFDVAWRLMGDNFYDAALNNRDWEAVREKYRPIAAAVPDMRALGTVVSMMLGELNGSHLGFYPRTGGSPRPEWTNTTGHLGLRFDPKFAGPGLKVRDVIVGGPADQEKSRVEAGEIVKSIDGVPVRNGVDLARLMTGQSDRDVLLTVEDADGKTRDVAIRPTSFGRVRGLLYPMFEEASRAKVAELSGGKLGYIHVERMADSSFREFERQLFNAGYGKDGLVIDVRENGGGSTTDHMLTSLTQPRHAITVPRGGGRGYPHDRKIYASWNKPIAVLCNQNSFSNAEIFSHAVKTLGRGPVVGVTTAGGVISTGAASVMDMGTLRQPFRGWYLLDGQDMELNGCVPDAELWPLPGELPAGVDRQLEKAVELLKADVEEYLAQPVPELTNASERRAGENVAGEAGEAGDES